MAAGDRIFWSDVADIIRPPGVRLVQQAAQSIASAVNTALTWGAGSEERDTHNLHDTTTNPSRVTVAKTGRYQVFLTANMAAVTTISVIAATIAKNGVVQQPLPRTKPNTATSTTLSAFAEAELDMTAGDYVEGMVSQTSGGAVNTQASGGVNSTFEVRYVGSQ
jgi:cytoskeletal protein RodZ